MRRIASLLIIMCFFPMGLVSQIIDNRVNIGLGLGMSQSLPFKTLRSDGMNYPSLFGNFPTGFTPGIFTEYRFNKDVSYGVSMHYLNHGDWKGNWDNFILKNPALTQYTLAIYRYRNFKTRKNSSSLIHPGFLVGPTLSHNVLVWEALDNENHQEIYPTNESKLKLGLKTGFVIQFENTQNLCYRLELNYKIESARSAYYLDKYYHSLNVSISISYKILKNRYFYYE